MRWWPGPWIRRVGYSLRWRLPLPSMTRKKQRARTGWGLREPVDASTVVVGTSMARIAAAANAQSRPYPEFFSGRAPRLPRCPEGFPSKIPVVVGLLFLRPIPMDSRRFSPPAAWVRAPRQVRCLRVPRWSFPPYPGRRPTTTPQARSPPPLVSRPTATHCGGPAPLPFWMPTWATPGHIPVTRGHCCPSFSL